MTIRSTLLSRLLGAALLALAGFGAQAQDLRIGVLYVDPSVSSDGIKGDNALGKLLVQPGSNSTLGSATTLLFTYQHHVTERIGIELVAGLPPKHNILGAGTLKPGEKIGTLKQFAPTLLFNYHFADRKATWRPVVGFGPVYATVRNIELDPTVQPNTTATAEKRWGWAAQAGMAYALDAHWHVQGSFSYSRLTNKLSLSTDTSKAPYTFLGVPAGTALSSANTVTNNSTLSVTLGYSF